MGAKYTEAQKRAAEKYKVAHREQLKLDLPKGSKASPSDLGKGAFLELIKNHVTYITT